MRMRAKSLGFTLVELLVVITIIGILIALLLPAVQAAREAARRMQCTNQLKQIGLGVLNYEQANKVFPPGAISRASGVDDEYPWDSASQGEQGTSWMLRILPYLELNNIFKQWNFKTNVVGNAVYAITEVKGFYCPTRRPGFRSGTDLGMMLDTSSSSVWTGGGTDYGGCAGRLRWQGERSMAVDSSNGFSPGYCTAKNPYPTDFISSNSNTITKCWGIFGQVNKSASFSSMRDGSSNTIITGELQRYPETSGKTSSGVTIVAGPTHDGWSIGGDATLFSTGQPVPTNTADGTDGAVLINNGYWASPGSEHAGTSNFGLGDGSVRSLSNTMDASLFSALGSMADGTPASLSGN